ncbi:MAG: RagB/SusD family nutrient uptake outer membrane protein [Tannerellaceae bacterium]|jgi:tetratricopeptide (TPR) repeat protein|nr:RagB/SusD family nutrient uptake outer membrane protein [Tannerellaceae bacterium]
MNTKIITYGILAIGMLLITGCSDFLDTEQRGVITQDGFYQTDEEVEEALYAIYNKVQGDDLNTFQFKNLLSDDATAGGGGRGDNAQGEELDEYRFGTSNSIIRAMFTKYYQIVYTANLLIDKVKPESEAKKIALAEAKTFRAYAYFELVTLWGPVPLVIHPLNPDEYAQSNAKTEDIWMQIEQDLLEAIPDLPLKSQLPAAKKGNVSKGTAQAWLGKAYLFQKKYEEAAAELDKVIAGGEYQLNPDFSTLTRQSSEFGSESIFEVSYADELSTITEGTRIVAYCGPRTPWFKAGTSGITETGWGWSISRIELYDAFVAAGEEVRRKGTIMSEQELIDDFGGSFRIDGNLPYGSDGSIRIKHGTFVDETPGEEYHTISGMNFRITRYADVLLMAAEAHNRKPSPDDAKALSYVNRVRARAQMPDLTSTGDKLFEDMKQERRFELAFEFVRYQDLIRWGDAAKVLADKGKRIPRGDGTYFEFPDAGFKERHWLLPFPESEMNVNPNLTQNPGW